MKYLPILAGLLLVGCNLTEEQQIKTNRPIRIAETNGVTLWRVIDGISADTLVYFTTMTPTNHYGDVAWRNGGKTYHQVPGVLVNSQPVFLEDP